MSRQLRVTALAAVIIALAPAAAMAQYFGQNKVRYDNFDFKVLKTEHFDIYYYDREQRAIGEAARMAERWYARLSEVLGQGLTRRQPLILYASHADFWQTTAIGGPIGEGTGGVTEALRNRVVLPFTASLAETDHVLGHELVHAFQFDMSRGRALRLPLWFVEGMAEYLSLGPVHSQTALWLRDAAMREELPGFEELDNPQFFPYRFGHAAWAYIAGRWGDGAVRTLFLEASEAGDPLTPLEGLTKTPVEELSDAWHQSVYATYRGVADSEFSPRGQPLITEDGEGGRLNIGPALSPDGERLIFLSERELFSIEMFVADAHTGEVIRKLTEFATNPHFDSIQFLQSTGAWAADNRRFVYSTVKAADPHLVIVDVTSGDTLREIELDSLGEVLNPTWSPDGRYIAFSGLSGGVSDLFLYDLQENSLRQVTDDLAAQVQPRWSPDGRAIALVTDQLGTGADDLAFGNYQLALYDVGSGTVRPLRGFENAKNINPQWAPDGTALYFIADPNGIPNVFRMQLSTGVVTPVTSVATGVTGITGTSPALDIAATTGQLAYSLFSDGEYSIYTLDPENGDDGQVELSRTNAAVLPPAERTGTSVVRQFLHSPGAGLPSAAQDYPVQPYDPDLGLSHIGAAATTGVGASSAFGRFVGGGVSVLFSDMLNFHQVTDTVDVNGGVRDIGGQVGYLNQSTRWNWGGAVQYVPFVTGSFTRGLTEIDGETVFVEQERIFRQTNRQFLGVAEYPFNRATRLEFSAGLRSLAFDREVNTNIFSAETGRLLDEQSTDLDAPDTINLAQTTAAFVYDTSVFGATSPVLGSRSRFELTPTFGSLNFAEVIADARHYAVPIRPLTLAGRVLHFGRYGSDSEDARLTPLFLGYPNMVRGYDTNSFSANECVADQTSNCPAFDRLVGTRLFVANVELRFPLVGIFQREFNYGPLPIEGFLFGDTGIAWTSDNEPSFLAGDRQFVSSAGAGVRVNAFGYLILEFAGVKPFDRPDSGWRFVFNILPGF